MAEIDPRVLQAAIDGSLPIDDVIEVMLAVLDLYGRHDAEQIIEAILSEYRSRTTPSQKDTALLEGRRADVPRLRRAQGVLLQEAREQLGDNWLLDWPGAVGQFSQAFGPESASAQLESHRRAGYAVAVVVRSEFRFPRFQFEPTGNLVPAAARVNRVLRANTQPWSVLTWWIYPDGRLLDRRPFELLNDPEAEPILTRLAQASVGQVI
jgi:hypothetical protein